MPFPTTSLLDDFNRADGPLGPAWTDDYAGNGGGRGLRVVGNQAAGNLAAENTGWYSAQVFPSDQEAWTTVSVAQSTGEYLGVALRLTSPGVSVSGYEFDYAKLAGTDSIEIYRVDSGVYTQLGTSVAQEIAAGDQIGAQTIGSTLTFWHRPAGGAWTQLVERTDTTYSGSGYLGLFLGGNVVRVDDFGGGEIPPVYTQLASDDMFTLAQTGAL